MPRPPTAPFELAPSAAPTAPARPGRFARLFLQEDLNFLLTNRIPRRTATLFMGWFSRLRSRWLTRLSIAVWRRFSPDLDLSESREREFASLHDCFVRELRPGARPVDADPAIVVSPCDAIVGAHGRLDGVTAIQAKGFPYSLRDLLGDDELVERHRHGTFVTLRLRSSMYHRFHAPYECRVRHVDYVSGDTWNVNPIALRRVERLFCKNERAVLDLQLSDPTQQLTLVPVAAILVASMRFHCLPQTLDLRYRGPNRIPCDARFAKGDEIGFFQHGSTILVFATGDFELADGIAEGTTLRMGRPLFTNRRLAGAQAAPRTTTPIPHDHGDRR